MAAMTVQQVFAHLEPLGDPARRKHNTKHGAGENHFGVKMGDIRALAKKIKSDHALGLELWETGNVEAQFLAALIMKPKALSALQLDRLARTPAFSEVADWLIAYIIKEHPERESLRQKWMSPREKDRWAARAGWSLTAGRINKHDLDSPEPIDPESLLDRIEKSLAKAAPEVQWTMNNTLAAIGINCPALRKRAVAIGEAVGLYRDWPVSKGCTPPYIPVWVAEMVKRQK